MKCCREFKILNKKIVKQWYIDIILDKVNWPIVLEAIEAQINVSDDLYIKLKPEMKKVFILYVNDVTDLIIVLDFHNVIQNLKSPMMDNLSFIKNIKHFNVVNTIYDEISADSEFSNEMIRMYNNILSNKLDNDDIGINNKSWIQLILIKAQKNQGKKCNIKDSYIKNNQETSIIISSSKQLKKTINW